VDDVFFAGRLLVRGRAQSHGVRGLVAGRP
jgi:hypothetical protein